MLLREKKDVPKQTHVRLLTIPSQPATPFTWAHHRGEFHSILHPAQATLQVRAPGKAPEGNQGGSVVSSFQA